MAESFSAARTSGVPLLRSQLMIFEGKLRNEDVVAHVVASKIRDYSHWLVGLEISSRDFH